MRAVSANPSFPIGSSHRSRPSASEAAALRDDPSLLSSAYLLRGSDG